MSVADVIRQRTLQLRGTITDLDKGIEDTQALMQAAEERVKRLGTEITQQRKLETAKKQFRSTAEENVKQAQLALDELERKRQLALDELMRCQDEYRSVGQSIGEAERATQTALSAIKKEEKTKENEKSRLTKLRADREKSWADLRRGFLEALDVHLEQQAVNVHAAFSTQEQRSQARRELGALNRARHTDPEIGGLCEQRDELRKFLSTAMVPNVKAMLQESLKEIENRLVKRFPGALQVPESAPKDNQIEELLYYRSRKDKVIFLLPIRLADWSAAAHGEISDPTTKCMCLAWNMIKELDLKTKHGSYMVVRDHPAFVSTFDLEDVAILHDFSVKYDEGEVMRFVLAPVPPELQEALSDEDQDI